MTTIYLIRHAEAEGNLYRRAQGQYDSNVTPLGMLQIAALAERFKDIPLDALYSSDLTRTQSTAGAILKYHPELPLQTTALLREQSIGVWEDTAWGNLARDWPEQMAHFSQDPERFSVPGCEAIGAVVARMKEALLDIARKHEGQTVAVFSHGMAIRALLCELLNIPLVEIHRIPHGDNTAVHLLRAEAGALRVEYYNDNSHLSDELSTFARQSWWRKEGGGKEDHDNVLFEPLRFPADEELYLDCYEATWLQSHGNLKGYIPSLYHVSARKHLEENPQLLVKMLHGETFAGLIELDTLRGLPQNAGWISLIYVKPEFRQRRLGVQLLGHAVSLFRAMGRESLGLHVSQTNEEAIGFYEHYGFRRLAAVDGVGGKLWHMEMDLRRHIFRLP